MNIRVYEDRKLSICGYIGMEHDNNITQALITLPKTINGYDISRWEVRLLLSTDEIPLKMIQGEDGPYAVWIVKREQLSPWKLQMQIKLHDPEHEIVWLSEVSSVPVGKSLDPETSIVRAYPNILENHEERIENIERTKFETYRHHQDVASHVWEINHELGKYPSVTVVDSAGSVVTGNVDYVSENIIRLTFSGAFAGTAYLN